MQNLIGSFGRANLALAGLAGGIGILILGGKSMVEISEKHDQATRGLAQAYASAGINLNSYQLQIDSFITTNRPYISSQSEVLDGYAKLTRSGLTQTEVQKDMSRAVDLAALKHISLSDAVELLDNAEHGRMRGLIDLGITTAKYTDEQGNLILANHSVAKSMEELDPKLKGGRDTLTDLQKQSNILNSHWQDLSTKGGPVLLILLDKVVTALSGAYDALDRIGKDDKLWATINDRLVKMASWIKQYVVDPLHQASDELNANPTIRQAYENYQKNSDVMTPKAAGGPVLPNRIYTVGEAGPETLVMGSQGGTVIPNGGSSGGQSYYVTVNVAGSVQSERSLTLAIREGIRRLDREQR